LSIKNHQAVSKKHSYGIVDEQLAVSDISRKHVVVRMAGLRPDLKGRYAPRRLAREMMPIPVCDRARTLQSPAATFSPSEFIAVGKIEMFAIIQRLIDQEAKLAIHASNLTPRANLYDLGLTSFDAIRLLVAVERAFKIEFQREILNRESVASIEAIARAVQAMQEAPSVEVRKAA
jgi:acyl carrier protein